MKKVISEVVKIAENPFAFLEHVRIQEPGELALRYELWPRLVQFYKALEEYRLLVVIKSKQVGLSWAVAVRVLRKLMTTPGSNILMLSSGQKESQNLLSKVKVVYENLPGWLREIPEYREAEPNSTEQFGFKGLRSLVTALPSTEKAGIGHTSDWVIHDEADFHDFIEANLGHTLATVADGVARQATVISTVDKTTPDSYFKRLYRAAEEGKNGFKTLFFPYNSRPNRDEAWYEGIKKENENTPWVVEANYPRTIEEALSPVSSESCFNRERLAQLANNVAGQPETRKGFIYILCPPAVGTQYVAGVDVGEGVGLDYSCLSIVGKRGLMSEVVAAVYSNTLGTDAFAYEVDQLCREYFIPKLIVDNIGIGRAVIDKLMALGYPNLSYSDTEKKKAGFTLTRQNKRERLATLVEVINNGSLVTRWGVQVKEMREYKWVNGYPEPTGRTHGDTIIPLILVAPELPRLGIKLEASQYIGGHRIW